MSHIGEIEIGRKFPSASILQKISDALGMKPYELFLSPEDKTEFDRYEVITRLYSDLKDKINTDMEEIVRKYLGRARSESFYPLPEEPLRIL